MKHLFLALAFMLGFLGTDSVSAAKLLDFPKYKVYDIDTGGTMTYGMWFGTIWLDDEGNIVKSELADWVDDNTYADIPDPDNKGMVYRMKDVTVDGKYNPATGKFLMCVYHQPAGSQEKVLIGYWNGYRGFNADASYSEDNEMCILPSRKNPGVSIFDIGEDSDEFFISGGKITTQLMRKFGKGISYVKDLAFKINKNGVISGKFSGNNSYGGYKYTVSGNYNKSTQAITLTFKTLAGAVVLTIKGTLNGDKVKTTQGATYTISFEGQAYAS